jgi:hypothetical protein
MDSPILTKWRSAACGVLLENFEANQIAGTIDYATDGTLAEANEPTAKDDDDRIGRADDLQNWTNHILLVLLANHPCHPAILEVLFNAPNTNSCEKRDCASR